jgi:hypothetical protein
VTFKSAGIIEAVGKKGGERVGDNHAPAGTVTGSFTVIVDGSERRWESDQLYGRKFSDNPEPVLSGGSVAVGWR